MKKFITAICGIIVATSAMGAPGNYAHPKDTNLFTSSSEWKVIGKYDKTLHGNTDLYKGIDTEMCYLKTQDAECTVKAGEGTYDDEKAVVLHIAKKIYTHGAEFCTIQVQPGNANLTQWVWLDYYHKPAIHACYTYCKPGYDPDNECKLFADNADVPCETEYTPKFGSREMITSGGRQNNGRITTDMVVFSYENETGAGENNKPVGNKTTKHKVLGIVKEIDNGVIVAPMEITGRRDAMIKFGTQSWIYDVATNGNETVLCIPGYEAQNSKCVVTQRCRDAIAAAQNAQKEWCSGYNYYDKNQHTLKINTSKDCKYYRCSKANYGFQKNTSHKCGLCETWIKGGILHGSCTECATGEVFRTGTGCMPAPGRYTHKQLEKGKNEDKECWMKTDPTEFCQCVTGGTCQ